MLAQIESARFARHRRLAGVIQNVVSDLKGHTEPVSVLREHLAIARRATQCTALTGTGKKRRGLATNQLVVVRLTELQAVDRGQLPHLSDRKLIRDVGHDAQDLEIGHADERRQCARVEIVSHDD